MRERKRNPLFCCCSFLLFAPFYPTLHLFPSLVLSLPVVVLSNLIQAFFSPLSSSFSFCCSSPISSATTSASVAVEHPCCPWEFVAANGLGASTSISEKVWLTWACAASSGACVAG